MKLLWIYPELPYPLTSGLLRGYFLLRELGKRHAISFLMLTHQWPVPAEVVPALRPYAERVEVFPVYPEAEQRWLNAIATVPALGWRMREAHATRHTVLQMRERVQHLLATEHFDVALFSGRETIPVLDAITVPLAIDIGDANCGRIRQQMRYAPLARLPGLLYRCLRTTHEEKLLARATSFRSFISMRDREGLLGANDRSQIVPQGIDYKYWTRTVPPPGQNCVAFSGVMNYAPNNDAAMFLLNRILPLVRQKVPKLQVLIIGRDPSPDLRKAAARHPDVTVTGAVPDVRPWLERADVYVAALRFASGVQNKVLEAMSMQLPVVTTPVVAAGLKLDCAEPPLVVGTTAEQLAAGVTRLLTSEPERACFASEGRKYVEDNCSWSASAAHLEQVCLAAAQSVPAHQAA